MNRRWFPLLVICLTVATVAFAESGGLCGLRAGCATRPNFTRCLECCHGAGCQHDECRGFCHNVFRRFKPGTPNQPVAPVVS